MFTAETANKKSRENRNKASITQMQEIQGRINTAIEKGEFHANYYAPIILENKMELENLGFKIKTEESKSMIRNEDNIKQTISW
jgi:hypothetical protein